MPAGDDGVGVLAGRVVFVGWGISVGPAVLDGRDVLAGFEESDDTSMVTAVWVVVSGVNGRWRINHKQTLINLADAGSDDEVVAATVRTYRRNQLLRLVIYVAKAAA